MHKGVLGLVTTAIAVSSCAATAGGLAQVHGLTAGPQPVTVYLHRDGGRVESGNDSSARGTSSSVQRAGVPHVDIPPFRGDDAAWAELTNCVESAFAEFDVTVVDERPARGKYIAAMIGGSPDQLGFAETVEGIAPYDGKLDTDAIVFVFERAGDDVDSMCTTTAHEIGHALGLDHTRDCEDVMSYEDCGHKSFKDEHMACGEWEDRHCGRGKDTQNSRAHLAAVVGDRPEDVDWTVALANKAMARARSFVATAACTTCSTASTMARVH